MNELQAISTVAGSLKPAVDLAQSVLRLIGTGKGGDEALKLYGQIVAAHQSALAAQEAQAALLKEKSELEAKLGQFENWEREKIKYELKEIGPGCLAYVLKSSAETGEPPHMICPKCYQERNKRILQAVGQTLFMGRQTFTCPECGSQLAGPQKAMPPPRRLTSDYDPYSL